MAHSAFVDEVVGRLAALDVRARSMFGGHGLYIDDVMMGLIADDQLYFKTTDANRAAYEEAGCAPFSYERAGRPAVVMSYHAVPAAVFDETDALIAWASAAAAAARVAKRSLKPSLKRSRPRRPVARRR